MGIEKKVAIQPSFLFPERRFPLEPLRSGAPAEAVFLTVLQLNPLIQRISYIPYKPDNRSDGEMPAWTAREWINASEITSSSLQDLHARIRKRRNTPALAICSSIETLNGETMHIPMMDFTVENTSKFPQEIFELLGQRRGAILRTDASYHFWGFDLLTELEWNKWMSYCLAFEMASGQDDKLIDVTYVLRSLEKRFAALRLYAYPKAGKKTQPVVEEIIH